MKLLDGKKVKEEKLKDLKEKISLLDRKLGLTVIQVGDDYASSVYIKQKEIMANTLNVNFNYLKLSSTIKEDKLLEIIDELNNNDLVDGIIIQMPLPTNLNSNLILNKISYKKDVDGLTDINMGRLIHNNEYLSPCTPTGIIDLLDYYNIDISSKNITIIGRSNLVGKPLFNLFINRNATVTLCHSKTLNLKEYTKNADILVVAVGIPNFITADFIKENAIVIDVGINRVDNKIVGDVNFTNVSSKTSYITPTPGGVGPMTVYELFNNTYKAYILGQNKRD